MLSPPALNRNGGGFSPWERPIAPIPDKALARVREDRLRPSFLRLEKFVSRVGQAKSLRNVQLNLLGHSGL
jgi:hypothetical protein